MGEIVVISLLAMLIGGVCTAFGVILGVSIHNVIYQRKDEENGY